MTLSFVTPRRFIPAHSTTYYDYFGTGLPVGAVYLLIGFPLSGWRDGLKTDSRSMRIRAIERRRLHPPLRLRPQAM